MAQQPAQTSAVSTDGRQAIELARTDFNFLAALVDPAEFRLKFPEFYIALFSLLTAFTDPIERFAIGIPRGFAKTTYIKLLCIWYILFSDKQFILIVGAAEKLALNTLADICDMLGSQNIRALFGDWDARIEEETKEQKVFYFRGRHIILKAIGAGSSVRGVNRKNARPDVIILDDVQKKEDAENEAMAKELLQWILGTLGMARSNKSCTYIYVGNMYPRNAILDKLRVNSEWTSFVVGGLLADGTSLWEELRPADQLISEYVALKELGEEEIFNSEILNSVEGSARSGLDLNKIPVVPNYMLEVEPEGSFILIDPSSGKKDGDDLTIEHFSVVDGIPIFDDLDCGTMTPLETIKSAIALGFKYNTRLICVEDVAYQSTLLFWFNHYCNEQGISGFEFWPVSPKNRAKNTRIKKGIIKFMGTDAKPPEMYLGPKVRSRYLEQAMEWNPLKTDNRDDIIDPPGYVEEVLQLYPEYIIKNTFDVLEENVSAAHESDLALPF
jgi:hypothetical protein